MEELIKIAIYESALVDDLIDDTSIVVRRTLRRFARAL